MRIREGTRRVGESARYRLTVVSSLLVVLSLLNGRRRRPGSAGSRAAPGALESVEVAQCVQGLAMLGRHLEASATRLRCFPSTPLLQEFRQLRDTLR